MASNVFGSGLRFAFVVGVSAMALASAARAQSAEETSAAAEDGDIVVTAQKRAQSVNDVGITLNVFTGDTLRAQGIDSAQELGQITPGLVVNETGAQGVPIYTLRGVGFSNIYVNASSTVGLYVDDVSVPYAVMTRGALFDIERVEVLKGPQGDLYGRNTTAGQINFITGKPTEEFDAGASVEYGRFNAFDGEAFVSGPIANGVQVRVAGKQTLSSGWQKSLSRPDDKMLGAQDQTAFRGKINFDLGASSSLLLEAHWSRDQSDNIAATTYDGRDIGLPAAQALPTIGTPIYSLGDNRAADWTPGFRPKRDNKIWGGSARLDLDVGPVALTALTAYDKFTRSETSDWDGAALNDSASINDTRIEAFSQELRLASNGESDFTWIVGGYYSWDKLDEGYNYFMGDSYFATALGITELFTKYTQKTESLAGFGHVEYQITPTIQLIGGVRYTHETRSFQGCTYDRNGTLAAATNNIITPFLIIPAGLPDPGLVAPGGCAVYDDRPDSAHFGTFDPFDEKIKTNKWMWKGGINYKPSRDLLLYATVSSGFKSGGFNGANSNTQTQLRPYNPERLTAYEVGAKGDIRSLGLNLNGAVFYYDYKDKQESGFAVTFVGNIGGLTNIPKSRIYGAEVSANWRLTDQLSLNAGATYLNSKIKQWEAVSNASLYPNIVTYDASGLPLPNAPKWSLNATPSYKVDVGSDMTLEFATDAIYRDSTSGAGLPYQMIEDYWLFNARVILAKQDNSWQVSLWGKNIFNNYYYQYAAVGGNGPYVRVVGMPVTYGVRLGVNF